MLIEIPNRIEDAIYFWLIVIYQSSIVPNLIGIILFVVGFLEYTVIGLNLPYPPPHFYDNH